MKKSICNDYCIGSILTDSGNRLVILTNSGNAQNAMNNLSEIKYQYCKL